ncbi:hypothetical protein [Engelhardtia mirabilis]|uniref:Uncharacterized protein n=1 Tax=Engelhardtia mirabilis TaxID=2528011 RepID=A0A518BS42_9BACT|nr:hypothetical protein Pla133_49160 [Planctomycetes bacterium Pla133]QDV04120.1 hypothetical protein Pla86_49140 [Planctomycetes bacterium Pla86]
MESTNRPRLSPFCADLGSKKLLLNSKPPMTEEDVLDASNHCWCRRTNQVLGPDREVAVPELCRSGRSCFRSLFDSLT